jgi:3-dehydroquinate dehydratase/shikimate dehydrogenase
MTAKTLGRNLEILEKYRDYADMAELRADCLDPDERLLIRRFPEQAGTPVILTIRRDVDGGRFVGGEGARVSLMARGLAYAETDRRRNFAYLDIEDDLDVPSLEEAARTFGTRIIRSYHNTKGTDTDLPTRIRSMRRSEDDIVKISVTANSTRDVLTLLRAGKECPEQEKIIIAMGHYGSYSRILAEQFGSYLSYSSAFFETDSPAAAPGQIEIQDLASIYHFRNISKTSKIYGVVGNPLKATGSPQFFNTIFDLEGTNAVYVPFPVDSITDFMEIANELKVEGVSVTVPYKEAVIPFLDSLSDDVRNIGACNTLCLTPQGWMGTNTDARGFSDSLLAFLGISSFKRKRVTVIGAGGAARAVVFELHRLGAKVLILNRTALKARRLAVPYKFAWGGLDDRKIEMVDKYHDIIIQTTSVGMEGTETGEFADSKDPTGLKDMTGLRDPLAMYSFSGREEVMDLIYMPKTTPFLRRASHAGCNVLNGYDMLIRQARYQYIQFTGKDFPEHFTSKVRFGET